ncbi:hypothetical protein BaRGS_00038605 [Batillaria attramentaria]|uniref:Uncharacterized protein n=1 Tax=Batillaria attramentaria TaxID=370345 RepID=A0ABD0J5L4_9CAEN
MYLINSSLRASQHLKPFLPQLRGGQRTSVLEGVFVQPMSYPRLSVTHATYYEVLGECRALQALGKGQRFNEASSEPRMSEYDEYEDLVEQAEECPDNPLAVNARDSQGWTLLMRAAVLEDYNTIMHLVFYDADLDARRSDGTTALMLAVQHAECPVAAILLEAGARINDEDNQGETALIKAIKRGDKEMLKLILENGANYTVGKSAGFNAIQLAEVLGSQEIRTTLIDYITKVAAEFEKEVLLALKPTAKLLEPLFPYQCYPVFEKRKQVSWFDYEQLQLLEPGMGFILFIGTTKADNYGVTCKLKGHRAVTGVYLNGVPQRCLSELKLNTVHMQCRHPDHPKSSKEDNSIVTFKPVKEGKNELVICFNIGTTSSAKVVVRAYKAQLHYPELQCR